MERTETEREAEPRPTWLAPQPEEWVEEWLGELVAEAVEPVEDEWAGCVGE